MRFSMRWVTFAGLILSCVAAQAQNNNRYLYRPAQVALKPDMPIPGEGDLVGSGVDAALDATHSEIDAAATKAAGAASDALNKAADATRSMTIPQQGSVELAPSSSAHSPYASPGAYGGNSYSAGSAYGGNYYSSVAPSYSTGVSTGVCSTCQNHGCQGGCRKLGKLGLGSLLHRSNRGGRAQARGWFGGAYYLYMDRDDDGVGRPLAYGTGTPSVPVLSTGQARMDDSNGFAVRVGKMINCNTGIEAVYWQLFPEGDGGLARSGSVNTLGVRPSDYTAYASNMSVGANVNSEITFGNLRTPGGGNVSDFYTDSQLMEVRRNFDYRNFELNFLRLPISGYGFGSGKSRLALLAGARYFRAEEQLSLFTDDLNEMPGDDNANEFIYYNNIENHLFGGQIGAMWNYCISCRWSAQLGAKVGVYNNRMESLKRVTDGDNNYATFGAGADAGRDVNVESSKDDIAFLTELDAGLAYQVNSKWRLSGGYKVLSIAGYADGAKQFPASDGGVDSFGLIHDQSSLVLHGLYFGAERCW